MLSPSSIVRTGLLLSSLVTVAVSDDDLVATTKAQDELPPWASNSLQLKLSTDSTNYVVIPLTQDLAQGNGDSGENNVVIHGNLRAVYDTNFNDFNSNSDVAYISCDEPEETTLIGPDKMLNELMKQTPKAIVLFSTSCNWCSLSYDGDLSYTNILSMVDPGEAAAVLNNLNGTSKGATVDVSIYGNTTYLDPSDSTTTTGSRKSSVAMAVLYSITGLITFLFLVIIITGGVKAHRNPGRYGPRRGVNGAPGQSRAKGLARAVLETLPIVKFGGRQELAPDPDVKLETATTEGQYPAAEGAGQAAESRSMHPSRASTPGSGMTRTSVVGSEMGDELMSCSICTEDFKAGEDVRVLPCNHQYHPNCVDPWLINVSGTCPLCRLDLRPGRGEPHGSHSDGGNAALPPPLAWEMSEHDTDQHTYRTRLSRLFDINRLRQASVEEQMQALRQLREDGLNGPNPASGAADAATAVAESPEPQSAGFADKLREKFRILTRPQTEQRQTC